MCLIYLYVAFVQSKPWNATDYLQLSLFKNKSLLLSLFEKQPNLVSSWQIMSSWFSQQIKYHLHIHCYIHCYFWFWFLHCSFNKWHKSYYASFSYSGFTLSCTFHWFSFLLPLLWNSFQGNKQHLRKYSATGKHAMVKFWGKAFPQRIANASKGSCSYSACVICMIDSQWVLSAADTWSDPIGYIRMFHAWEIIFFLTIQHNTSLVPIRQYPEPLIKLVNLRKKIALLVIFTLNKK